MSEQRQARSRRGLRRGTAAALALGLIAAAGLVLLTRGRTADEPERRLGANAELVPVEQLLALADSVDEPIFWVGERAGVRYELSRTPGGRIYIRYLPAGVEAGDPRAGYLTVGTYPVESALAATRRAGEARGAVVRRLEGGALAVYNERSPTSVFVAFPGTDRQIEIYDPKPGVARELAYSARVKPILTGSAPPEQTGRPVAVTEKELRVVAAGLGGPLYWAGPMTGFTYELTRLPDGEAFVRYLPAGIAVGDQRPDYLTVGTYPADAGGLAAARAAGGDDAVTLDLANDGKAYYDRESPTNLHLAFPGSDHHVEVFHPVAAEARRLVRSSRIVPIR